MALSKTSRTNAAGRGRRTVLVALVLAACAAWGAEPAVRIAPDHGDGVYKAGETVTWTVKVAADAATVATAKATYVVREGGLKQIAAGPLELQAGEAKVTAKLDKPGTLLLSVRYTAPPAKPLDALGGAVYDPAGIGPSAPEPDDFDAFWAAKIKELEAVPVNAKLEPQDSGNPNVEYWKVTLDNIRGTHIYGQIAKPKGKTKLPALLQVQWAGVYGLPKAWVVGPASQGWLAYNIIAHDIPIDQPAEYYTQLSNTTLKGYPAFGREDREQSYFLRMYLACYRAVDYLTKHPDWNGQTLLVHGGSQGGGQSVVAAGIHPAVTGLGADVPAMCDHTGQLVGRSNGWPRLTGWQEKPDSDKALQVSRYFDAVNFAKRVKCKSAVVGVGLIDTTCAPAGVIAMFNALPCAKELAIMPLSGHGGAPGHGLYEAKHNAWLAKELAAVR